MIKSCEIISACAAIDDQPTVPKESKQLPDIEIKSYILALIPNTLTFLGGYHAKKKFNSVLNKVEK